MKFKKSLLSIFAIISLVAISGAAIGVGVYYIVKGMKDKEIKNVNPFTWQDMGTKLKEFSKYNSFKVQLITNQVGNAYTVSSGTAWSFFLDQTNNDVYWYLLTNFHVVNNALAYNQTSNPTNPSLVYNHNIPITKGFALAYTNEQTKDNTSDYQYKNLFSQKWPNSWTGGLGLIRDNDFSINVISDISNKNNNSDDLNLFSNSTNNLNDYYNLDMSILKIKFKKTIFNSYSNIFNKIANPYQTYLNNGNNVNRVSSNKYTYIAGNPAKAEQLVAAAIAPSGIELESRATFLLVNNVNNDPLMANLNNLYFRSWISKDYYRNWILSEGASGSAVYQFDNVPVGNDTNLLEVLPVGIYWGGGSRGDSFKPCFIPFVDDNYNIYNNFGTFLTSSYNF